MCLLDEVKLDTRRKISKQKKPPSGGTRNRLASQRKSHSRHKCFSFFIVVTEKLYFNLK